MRAFEVIREPRPTVILETLTGATLAYLIDTGTRRLPLTDVIHLGLHLCSAIQYLHRHSVLHLDLKPSNIVSECRMAKILDLSIASPPGQGTKGSGTPNYMAPESSWSSNSERTSSKRPSSTARAMRAGWPRADILDEMRTLGSTTARNSLDYSPRL